MKSDLLDGLFDLVGHVHVDLDVSVSRTPAKHEIEGDCRHDEDQNDGYRGYVAAVAVGHDVPPVLTGAVQSSTRAPIGRLKLLYAIRRPKSRGFCRSNF